MLEDKLVVCSTALFTYLHIYHIVKSRSGTEAAPEMQQKVQQQQTKQEEQQQQQEVRQDEPQENDKEQPQERDEEQPQERDEEQPQDQLQEEQVTQLFSTLRNNLVPAAMGLTAVCVLKAIIN
ncbi:transcription factor TBF1-like [Drosophila obscura]|uniref:transcription factor TBF1-like n=1 Tax=Drosophila obscura TaxID=7282 RepID=UPI001BB0EA0E|nr:transcription factor TBF1-like [Drosophila obscura]